MKDQMNVRSVLQVMIALFKPQYQYNVHLESIK